MFHGFEWDEAESTPWWASAGLPTQPLLDLDFERGTARRNGLIRDLDQIMSVNRATPATYVDADGAIKSAPINAPRFDWTGGKRALLLEAAATNLASAPLITWPQAGSGQATISAEADVLGGTSAIGITYDGTLINAGVYRFYPMTKGPYTVSLFVKWVSGATVWRIGLGGTVFGTGTQKADVEIDIVTGVVHSAKDGVVDVKFTALGGGWARVSVSAVCATPSDNSPIVIVSGETQTGMRSAVFSGAQLEASDTPTSYIPTGSTAVTRAADIAAPIDLSGFDLSGGYTVVVDGRMDGVSGAWDRAFQLDAGSGHTRQTVLYDRTAQRFRSEVVADGAYQAAGNGTPLAQLPSDFRCALALGPNIHDFALNGATYGHDETVNYVTPVQMLLGHNGSGGAPARLRLSRVSLYAHVMTAAQLEEATA